VWNLLGKTLKIWKNAQEIVSKIETGIKGNPVKPKQSI